MVAPWFYQVHNRYQTDLPTEEPTSDQSTKTEVLSDNDKGTTIYTNTLGRILTICINMLIIFMLKPGTLYVGIQEPKKTQFSKGRGLCTDRLHILILNAKEEE